jgi:hypothetical protein
MSGSPPPLPIAKKNRPGWLLWVAIPLGVIGLFVLVALDHDKSPANNTPSRQTVYIGDKIELPRVVLACRDIDVLEKGMQLATDHVAFEKYFGRQMALGACQDIFAGTRATVEDASILKAAVCIREDGETDCLWAKRAIVERSIEASAQ